MIASLPMYDRPETAGAHDRYWHHIKQALADHGIDAPDRLTRDADVWDVWRARDLVLAQTCGLPYRARLHGAVDLVGTPDYGLPDAPAGYYHSEIVIRADDPRDRLDAFGAATLAYNEALSQSGWAAIAATGARFGTVLQTGAHRASASAVAEGRADIAALDAVTWRDLARYEPALSARLRVLDRTAPTPGLPYITALGRDAQTHADAVAAAIVALAPADMDTLHLSGLTQISAADYLAQPLPPPPRGSA